MFSALHYETLKPPKAIKNKFSGNSPKLYPSKTPLVTLAVLAVTSPVSLMTTWILASIVMLTNHNLL